MAVVEAYSPPADALRLQPKYFQRNARNPPLRLRRNSPTAGVRFGSDTAKQGRELGW